MPTTYILAQIFVFGFWSSLTLEAEYKLEHNCY